MSCATPLLLASTGAAALRRLTAFAMRHAAEDPAVLLAETFAFGGAFTAVFFTGLRAAFAGLGLAFAAGLAADLAADFAAAA